jgi:hypothetical protein
LDFLLIRSSLDYAVISSEFLFCSFIHVVCTLLIVKIVLFRCIVSICWIQLVLYFSKLCALWVLYLILLKSFLSLLLWPIQVHFAGRIINPIPVAVIVVLPFDLLVQHSLPK